MTKRIELTVSDETWQRIETARELVPRAAWIKAAVDRALTAYDGRLELRAEVEELKQDPEKLRAALGLSEEEFAKLAPKPPFSPAEGPGEPVATVLGSPVRKSRKTPSLKDTWGR